MLYITQEDLCEIADQVLQKVLVENLSVSNTVVEATNYLAQQFETIYNIKQPNKTKTRNLLTVIRGGKKMVINANDKYYSWFADAHVKDFVPLLNKISVVVMDVANETIYQNWRSKLEAAGQSSDDGLITIYVPSVNGQIKWELFLSTLQHEVEHIFQMRYGYKVGRNKLMEVASQYLDEKGNQGKHEVAWLVYFLDSREINAKMQEIYQQLYDFHTTNLAAVKQCDGYKEYEETVRQYQRVKQLPPEELQTILTEYGWKPQEFWRYIEQQMHYFQTKLRKIVAWHYNNNREKAAKMKKALDARIERTVLGYPPYVFSDKFNWLPFPIR